MAVLPEYRGHGIAWKLMERVEKYARFHGYVRMFLWTVPFLEDAIGLYEKCGFSCTREPPQDFYGISRYTMEKRICWQGFINLLPKSV
jgi:GNAT superfamily N-acetyltransferase